MSAGESTPAPASVEQAASRIVQDFIEEGAKLTLLACVELGHDQETAALLAEAWADGARKGHARGHADAASADRAALARANELLRRCARFTEPSLAVHDDPIKLYNAIMDHLDGKTPPPTPSLSRSP